MGSISKRVPGVNKYSLSQTLCPDEVNRLKQYPHGRVMQDHEEPAYQLVQKINQVIANCSTPTVILQEIAQLLGTTFEVDCCLVTGMDNALEAISAHWCAQEYSGLLKPDEMFSVEHFDLSVVPSSSELLTIEEISTIENSIAVLRQYASVPIKSVMACVTKFAGNNNGVISLIKSQPYDWSEKEKKQLKAVESSCAIAFSQVMQAQLITTQQQHLLTCNQHQSLIKQLTILSRSNLEINQMLQVAIASCAEALQVDRGLLILLKYTNPLFKIQQQQIPNARAIIVGQWLKEDFYLSQQDVLEQSFLLSECSLCQRLFKDSIRPVIVNDSVDQDPATAASVFALSVLRAVLLMPLENQGKILGFLVLQQAEYRSWTTAELNIVSMVSAQMSNAIIQTQTLRQVQTLVDERTSQLQRSLEVQAKLYERTRQYVEQLRELHQLKDDFLSNMSDRLRYPLTNMRMALRNLRQPGINSERQNRYLNILDEECNKEINLINDLLTLQKLETQSERPQFASIDLNEKIKLLAASFEKKLADKGLRISLDLPQTSELIQTEVESFERILQELLTNTCKYSEPDTTVQLQVKHQNEHIPQVMIKVINVGRGISEEEATYIFDKFRRGKGRWTPGTGLGLALVKSLVQHLNGAITVESIPIENKSESNICFTLTLPQFSDESKTPN